MAKVTNAGGTHQRRSAEEWRDIFERRAASGLSIATFCQREGIAKSSYERWRTQLAHAARDAGPALSPTGVGFVDAGVLAQHRELGRSDVESELVCAELDIGHVGGP